VSGTGPPAQGSFARAISAKAINNARAALSGVLAHANRQGLLPHDACRFVAPRPIEHRELAYLRLSQIDRYLHACPAHDRRSPSS
jgi:hypothetical protein